MTDRRGRPGTPPLFRLPDWWGGRSNDGAVRLTELPIRDVELRGDGRVTGFAVCPECGCRVEVEITREGTCRYLPADVPMLQTQLGRAERALTRLRRDVAGFALLCQGLADPR